MKHKAKTKLRMVVVDFIGDILPAFECIGCLEFKLYCLGLKLVTCQKNTQRSV